MSELEPEKLAEGLQNLGYRQVASELQKIDRLLFYDEEISGGDDSDETLEKLTDIVVKLFDAAIQANETHRKSMPF